MNKIKSLLFALAVSSIYSCSSGDKTLPEITVDMNNMKSYCIDDIATDVKMFPIDTKEVMMGNVDAVKVYNDYIFFYCDAELSLHIFTPDFEYVGTLDKVGRAEGEYLSLFAFSYNPEGKFVTIFDNNNQRLMNYSVPELNYISSVASDLRFYDIEYFGEEKALTVSTNDAANQLTNLEITDLANSKVLSSVSPISTLATQLSRAGSIKSSSDNKLIYPISGTPNYVLEVAEQGAIDTLYTINFSNEMPAKYWNANWSDGYVAQDILSYLAKSGAAVGVHYFNSDPENKRVGFVFYNFEKDSRIPTPRIFFKDANNDYVISSLTLKDMDYPELRVAGVIGDSFVSIVYANEIEIADTESPISKRLIKLAKENPNKEIVIVYKF